MQSPIESARGVINWTNLGVKLPKNLTEAIQLYELVSYVEVGHTPTVNVETLTAANAEEVIRDLAQEISLATTPIGAPGPQGQGPLERAKKQVLEMAASALLAKASVAVPGVIEQLTPRFDQLVETYVEAVAKLPDEVTAESLVKGGVSAMTAYQNAQSAMAGLNSVSSWVAGTANLPGHIGNVDPALRILRPSNAIQLSKLDTAQNAVGVDKTLRGLNPVFYTAAKNGVEFGINTIRECSRIREELKITPAKIQFA